MDVELVLLRDVKQPQQRHRVLFEEILGRDRQPLAIEHEPFEARRRPMPQRTQESRRLRF